MNMYTNDFRGVKLSALGMGNMRLPVIGGKDEQIDMETYAQMIDLCMKAGINYYDTAWGYHAGNSETAVGEVMRRYPRDSYYLATKFPGYDLSNMGKVKEIFEKQLQKCQTEYFDFYLFHNVCEMNIDHYLDPKYGILDYLLEQKKNGRIRHLGFSCHGAVPVLKRFLEAYGEHMEFCQLQLNWLDWKLQDARTKVEICAEYDIPVWVMEPLRGGKLASLSEDAEKKLKSLHPEMTIPEWSFRFLQTIPNVTMVLSGMSTMAQLEENLRTFEERKTLNEEELQALSEIADEMLKLDTVPCTACRYCTTHCPMHLNIPELLAMYNEHKFTGGGFIVPMRLSAMPEEEKPSACIGCHSCEAVCPQQIAIPDTLAKLAAMLG